MSQKPTYETTIDSDRITTCGVALALVAVVAFAMLDIFHLVWGKAPARTSLDTIPFALCCLLAAFTVAGKLLKVGFALIGVQTAARAVLSYSNVPSEFRHVAAIFGLALDLAGQLIFIIAAVNWFMSAVQRVPVAGTEGPTD